MVTEAGDVIMSKRIFIDLFYLMMVVMQQINRSVKLQVHSDAGGSHLVHTVTGVRCLKTDEY